MALTEILGSFIFLPRFEEGEPCSVDCSNRDPGNNVVFYILRGKVFNKSSDSSGLIGTFITSAFQN